MRYKGKSAAAGLGIQLIAQFLPNPWQVVGVALGGGLILYAIFGLVAEHLPPLRLPRGVTLVFRQPSGVAFSGEDSDTTSF